MNELGNFALCLGWFLSLYGFVVGIYGAKKNNSRLQHSAKNATIGCALCLVASLAVLGISFLTDDYTNHYVWQFSNKDMPAIYKFTAIWGGMAGSMLLWAGLLALSAGIVAATWKMYPRNLFFWSLPVLNSTTLFFLTVTTFVTNPFEFIKADFIPPDGNGLNPLLQNPYMAVHPPTLYLGFTNFAIPFSFCMGALLSQQLSSEWIRVTRVWTLIAWGFLTAGIVMGGHWAYVELGWGGFWAWDPVENASFLPWLTGTAFLHSVMIQERKGMLKFWNVWLITLTFALTVFGTFLTRSGVVQSVHAFASTDVGWVFLLYLGIVFITALILTLKSRHILAAEKHIESVFSREAAFLMNNLLFLSICFAVLWGVLFPVLSEAVTGKKQTIGIPFFNAVTIPMFLALIFLMGVGTLIAWRKASIQSLRRMFFGPFIASLCIAALLVWAGVTSFYPTLSYSVCFFVFLTIIGELYRGMKAQRELGVGGSVGSLFHRHKRRYGGYLIHLGVLVVTVSITASMAHKTEKEFTLQKGESFAVGRFSIVLNNFYGTKNNNYEALVAEVSAKRSADGKEVALLKPEMRYYLRKKETTSEIALHMGPREDIYLVLAGISEDEKRVSFKVFINPLQIWLWFGALIMVVGTVIVLLPFGKTAAVAVDSREGVKV